MNDGENYCRLDWYTEVDLSVASALHEQCRHYVGVEDVKMGFDDES